MESGGGVCEKVNSSLKKVTQKLSSESQKKIWVKYYTTLKRETFKEPIADRTVQNTFI